MKMIKTLKGELVFQKRLYQHQKMELKKRHGIVKIMEKGMKFPKKSKIGSKDLEVICLYIKQTVKNSKDNDVQIERIFREFSYTKKDFNCLISKLKMIGEIYEWKRGLLKVM